MTTQHLLLLCALAGVALYVFWRLLSLLREGSLRAKESGFRREGSRIDDDLNAHFVARHYIEWRELNSRVRAAWPMRERCKQSLRYWTSQLQRLNAPASKSAAVKSDAVMDPLDGTGFEPHEAVIQCSCGTVYHEESWQWIGEKNGAKCVNCKKVGLVTHGCADDLISAVSSFARSFGQSLS